MRRSKHFLPNVCLAAGLLCIPWQTLPGQAAEGECGTANFETSRQARDSVLGFWGPPLLGLDTVLYHAVRPQYDIRPLPSILSDAVDSYGAEKVAERLLAIVHRGVPYNVDDRTRAGAAVA